MQPVRLPRLAAHATGGPAVQQEAVGPSRWSWLRLSGHRWPQAGNRRAREGRATGTRVPGPCRGHRRSVGRSVGTHQAAAVPSLTGREAPMARGGDRRPIHLALDRERELGTLLLGAMLRDPSPAGRRFRDELAALYARRRRLVRALACSTGLGLPSGGPIGASHVDPFLDLATAGQPVWYPPPRPLTATEQAEHDWRSRVIQKVIDDRLQDLGPRLFGYDPPPTWNSRGSATVSMHG